MSLAREHHDNHVVVGAGELYLIGPEGGERYLGESVSASVAVSTEYITIESADGPVAERLVHQPVSVTRRIDLALRDMTADNLALYILGEAGTDAQTAAEVSEEAIDNPRAGVWYQLGTGRQRPEGVWGIDPAVTVATKKGTAAKQPLAGANFAVDAQNGRIMFRTLTGSPDKALVTYTPLAGSLRRAVSSGVQVREFGLRYIEQASVGTGKRIFAPRCTIGPNGQMALKSRTTEQQLPLQVEILEPAQGDALVVYGPEGG